MERWVPQNEDVTSARQAQLRSRPGASRADAGGRRFRPALFLVAGGVIPLGLLLRSVPGAAGEVVGGVLFAVLLFLVVAFLTPAASAARIGTISFGICVVVELLQFTGLPAIAAERVPAVRYVLGSAFVASDLLAMRAVAAMPRIAAG